MRTAWRIFASFFESFAKIRLCEFSRMQCGCRTRRPREMTAGVVPTMHELASGSVHVAKRAWISWKIILLILVHAMTALTLCQSSPRRNVFPNRFGEPFGGPRNLPLILFLWHAVLPSFFFFLWLCFDVIYLHTPYSCLFSSSLAPFSSPQTK